jgi:hypothetical protein
MTLRRVRQFVLWRGSGGQGSVQTAVMLNANVMTPMTGYGLAKQFDRPAAGIPAN